MYLSSEVVKTAQRNLSSSRARPRVTDYLVFKRALVLSGGPTSHVVAGTLSIPYQDALSQWTLSGLNDEGTKYFNPFESSHARTAGFRTKTYVSTGPDNTWGGWQSSLDPTPVVHIRGTKKPKEFSFEEISAADLERHFLVAETADGVPKLPRLVDLAVWWLRDRDLESLGIDENSDPQELIDVVVAEAGLTGTEVAALFDSRDVTLDLT